MLVLLVAPFQLREMFAHVARGALGYCDLPTRLERPQSASGGEAGQEGRTLLAEESSSQRRRRQ